MAINVRYTVMTLVYELPVTRTFQDSSVQTLHERDVPHSPFPGVGPSQHHMPAARRHIKRGSAHQHRRQRASPPAKSGSRDEVLLVWAPFWASIPFHLSRRTTAEEGPSLGHASPGGAARARPGRGRRPPRLYICIFTVNN